MVKQCANSRQAFPSFDDHQTNPIKLDAIPLRTLLHSAILSVSGSPSNLIGISSDVRTLPLCDRVMPTRSFETLPGMSKLVLEDLGEVDGC